MTEQMKRFAARSTKICEAEDGEYVLYADYVDLLRRLDPSGRSKPEATAESADVRDAFRYRWLRQHAPDTLCGIAWRVKAATRFSEPDDAIDVARGAQK